MVKENKTQLNIYTFISITTKNSAEKNEMKQTIVYYSLNEICLTNSDKKALKKYIIYFAFYNQNLQKRKTNKYKEQRQNQNPMDENKNQMTLYNNLNEKDSPNHTKSAEEQLEKENFLKIYNYKYASGCVDRSDESNKKNYSSIRHGENIEQEGEQHAVGDADDEADAAGEDNINSEGRSTLVANNFENNYIQSEYKVINDPEREWSKEENDVNLIKTQTTTSPPSAANVETHTVATANVKNIAQHLNPRHLFKDFGEQFLHGQQLNVHNLLDVAGSLCAGPMGALCDMAAFSKLDFSPFGDLKDHTQNGQDFLAKKYYHPLYAHGVCRWPGCELPLDDMASFVKHLKTEHCLDDRSTAQARVQMQVVSQLEMHLQKERDRLQAMMHHLYLTKHFVMPEESQENIPHIRFKNAMRSLATTPDLHKSNNSSNDDSNSGNDLQSLLLSSGNINATRKRICDKSPLALAGGLPYMLERAGLDVQQEIQRNREFYKNADVRPPFTYASLIRQSIIESPDRQLTLNEIYNWFQNTFCYFRRNAATWKNAIRTNLSLHKCFVRYEDDFGSFWMVDDSEFVKRRHLSRGRPRGCGPSSSPNSNSLQFTNTAASATSHEVAEGGGAINDAIATTSSDLSTAGSSSRQRCTSSTSSMYLRSVSKNTGSGENNGGNDDYNVCEVSQRSPAGCQSHIQSGKKQYCGSKRRPHLQGSIIGIAIKTNTNTHSDHNRNASGTNNGGGVAATGNDLGISGIGEIGSVGGLGVDNHNGSFNSANTVIESEDPTGYDFHTQSLSSDAFLSSPPGSKSNMGRHSPNMQNMRSFGSSLTDEISSGEFACINNDRYRNLVTGLHLQSLTQRHHFQQHKQASQRLHPKTPQQQNALRNNASNQHHDVRSLHQPHAYHIYPTNQDEHQHQKVLLDQHNQALGQNIFGANIILSNTDKYFSHNIECRNDGETFKHESFNAHQQQQQQHHHNIRHHTQNSRSELSADEITNHIYIHHHNEYEIDVKYTPPLKTLYSFETQSFNRSDVSLNKRPVDDIYSNKFSAEENSGIVDCEREETQRKRRKNHMSSLNYDDVDIKAEADSESELRNIDIPLRTKSY